MSESSNHHIRKRSWGRFYVAPVLLDHRSYKWLLVTIIVMGAGSFFGGYISGYEKAEGVLMAEMGSMDLILPVVDISDLTLVEAQAPEIEEPGASIDVDSVDSDKAEKVAVVTAVINEDEKKTAVVKQVTENKPVEIVVEQKTEVVEVVVAKAVVNKPNKAIVEKQPVTIKPADIVPTVTKQVSNTQAEIQASMDPPAILGVGGPAAEPDVVVDKTTQGNHNIVEDATEQTARYSIQVGMYGNFNNAANRVEELIGKELNAYIHDYKNKQDQTRYNVRFGYFASFISAKQALDIFQMQHAGSGYIARVNH